MGAEPQLFRINPENRESERIEEVEVSNLGFQEGRDRPTRVPRLGIPRDTEARLRTPEPPGSRGDGRLVCYEARPEVRVRVL